MSSCAAFHGRILRAITIIIVSSNTFVSNFVAATERDAAIQQPEVGLGDFENSVPTACTEPVDDACWDEPAPFASAWKFSVAFIPTSLEWSENFGQALRFDLGHENADGFGKRVQFWTFSQESAGQLSPGFRSYSMPLDISASTLYLDVYKTVGVKIGNFSAGGGLAGGQMEISARHDGRDSEFFGGGFDAFAEGFYPVLRYGRTDLGAMGRGRLALMGGWWDESRLHTNHDEDWLTLIDELAWGIELRHRFGRHSETYWFADVARDLQDWGTPRLPYSADRSFQGTALNFGLVW
jgi:hypothetical protein